MAEITLSDGVSVIEVPDTFTPDQMRNAAQRADNVLRGRSQANQAIGGPPVPRGDVQGPPAPSEGLGGYLRGAREALETPDWLKRGTISAVTGLPDLGVAAVNSVGNLWNMARGSPERFSGPFLGPAVRGALGVPDQPADASFASRVGENLVPMVMGNPAVAGANGRTAMPLPLARPQTVGATGIMDAGGQVAGAVGAVAGEDFGRKQGGDLGATIGAIAGGMAPTAATQGVLNPAIRMALGNGPASRDAVALLDAAGITPRPGLVGNPGMGKLENSFAALPVVGARTRARQDQSFEEFQRALYGGVNESMPQPSPRLQAQQPETPSEIGGRARMLAGQGEQNLRRDFATRYDDVFSEIPPTTTVPTPRLDARVRGMNDPFVGESQATRNAVNDFVASEVDPVRVGAASPVTPGSSAVPPPGPNGIMPPTTFPTENPAGVPVQVARRARTEAFYDTQGAPRMATGAADQMVSALTDDTVDAILNNPNMQRAMPEAQRQALADRLRATDRDYRMENATDVSRSAPPTIPQGQPGAGTPLPGGGAFPALKSMQTAPTDSEVFTRASRPDNLAVLQRTVPGEFPQVAGPTIIAKSQTRDPVGDINVSPEVFGKWWRSLSPNEQAILANENPALQRQLGLLEEASKLYAGRRMSGNSSGTAGSAATIGGALALLNPLKVIAPATAMAGIGNATSSESLARMLGRTNAQTGRMLAERLFQAGVGGGAAASRRNEEKR